MNLSTNHRSRHIVTTSVISFDYTQKTAEQPALDLWSKELFLGQLNKMKLADQ